MMIALAIWLGVPLIVFPVLVLIKMIEDRELNPLYVFDKKSDMIVVPLMLLLWPLAVVVLVPAAAHDHYKKRKARLAEVREMVEAHYRNQWYE